MTGPLVDSLEESIVSNMILRRRLALQSDRAQGCIQPKVEGGGGAICRLAVKNTVRGKCAEGAQKFLGLYSGKILWFFN